MRKILYFILLILIIYILFKPRTNTLEHFPVAVMPNEFIQNNDYPPSGNNLDNYLRANYQPDNMDLKQFFDFTKDVAAYYPESNRIVNNCYVVPRVI